jgi:NADH dehydrogenase
MPDDPQTDAVTGAFGYSGAAITRDLLAAGHRVRTLTGHPGRAPAGTPVDVRPMDFTDPGALRRDLDGVHTLYNTYWIRFPRGGTTHETAVAHSRVLIDAAAQAGVRRVVHVSITHADDAAAAGYSYFRGKAAVEEHLQRSGLPYGIVRPSVLFGGDSGVLLNNIAWLLRHLPVFAIGGDGSYRLRPIHVDDLARLMLDLGGRTDNVTVDAVGPQSLTFRELIMAIRTATGSRAVIMTAPGRVIPPLSTALSLVLRDTLLTSDEYHAMTAGLADSGAPATGDVKLTDWITTRRESLGRSYANEIERHYR